MTYFDKPSHLARYNNEHDKAKGAMDCVGSTLRESVQIRSYFWSVFSLNAGNYGPEITPYLDTFRAVVELKKSF